MNRGQLRAKVKRDYPEVDGHWDDDDINTELNLAAIQVAYDTLCIPDDTKIDLVNSQANYNLTSLITDWIRLSRGIWYYDGSDWEKLDPKTPERLEVEEVEWRTMDDGDPEYYYLEGAELNLVPAPDADRTDGLHVYSGLKPTDMNNDNDDPFNNLSHLEIIHPLVCLWVGAEIKKSTGDPRGERSKLLSEYTQRVAQYDYFINSQYEGDHFPDITRVRGYNRGSFRR